MLVISFPIATALLLERRSNAGISGPVPDQSGAVISPTMIDAHDTKYLWRQGGLASNDDSPELQNQVLWHDAKACVGKSNRVAPVGNANATLEIDPIDERLKAASILS